MRPTFLLILFISCFIVFSQEKKNYKEYSFTEFFQMIEDEKDSVFKLKNALIVLDTLSDKDYMTTFGTATAYATPQRQDTIHIRKVVDLENVLIDPSSKGTSGVIGLLHNVVFHENVFLINVFADFSHCHFKKIVEVFFDGTAQEMLERNFGIAGLEKFNFDHCYFESDPRIFTLGGYDDSFDPTLGISSCVFKSNSIENDAWINISDFKYVIIKDNKYEGNESLWMQFFENEFVSLEGNDFGNRWMTLNLSDGNPNGNVSIVNNQNKFLLGLSLSESIPNLTLDWDQLKNGVIDRSSYLGYLIKISGALSADLFDSLILEREIILKYKDSVRIINETHYKAEVRLLGILTSVYKRQHDTQSSNASFVALKDLQTRRMEYLYGQNPSFNMYFEWKVNQFLKLFSDYGTKPSKAIVFSVYVIGFFAAIYLFFPNSWDHHGRIRIMNRYRFFLKYLNRDEGASEVYQEEREKELLPFHEFREYLELQGKTAPKFFYATALVLYKWSVSGSRLSGWFLSKIDVLNGKWSEVPKKGRVFKFVLVTGAFIIALVYDLFIKVLNAVMLSINTFTTLGFGEIPIKGLPRYLAIIQGFIGWFMLTIFSVSLISQLLN